MEITLGTNVSHRKEFADFLIANGVGAKPGNTEDNMINGVVIEIVDESGSLLNDILLSRWHDFISEKINSLPDGVRYVYYTYRAHPVAVPNETD